MGQTFAVRYEQDEDGQWTATAQVRPGETAISDGATLDEARTRIRQAVAVLLDVPEDGFELIEE